MTEEEVMRKYKYGYKHSRDLLNESLVKNLLQENKELKETICKLYEVKRLADADSATQFQAINFEFSIRRAEREMLDNKIKYLQNIFKEIEEFIKRNQKSKKEHFRFVCENFEQNNDEIRTVLEKDDLIISILGDILDKIRELKGDEVR